MSLDRYYTLGRTGLRVSRLALGTMTFGSGYGWDTDKNTSLAIFDRYVEAGGNFLDTAEGYHDGASEEWLGEFVKLRGLRDRVVITTKYGFGAQPGNPNGSGNGRKNLLRALEGSLRRLGTDYIDLYLLHAWDQVTPPDEVLRTFDDLVRLGKVRHVGFSNVPAWYASRAQTIAELRGLESTCALQLEYSLIERNLEFEYTQLATHYGCSIMAWSPLGMGLLSGKYRPSQDADGSHGAGRLDAMKNSGVPVFMKLTERNFAIVAELERVAQEVGRSMAQVALNWVVNRPGVASVVVGATTLVQLDDNLQALDFEIAPALRARLDAASTPERRYPYVFFGPEMQRAVHGGTNVAEEPGTFRVRD